MNIVSQSCTAAKFHCYVLGNAFPVISKIDFALKGLGASPDKACHAQAALRISQLLKHTTVLLRGKDPSFGYLAGPEPASSICIPSVKRN